MRTCIWVLGTVLMAAGCGGGQASDAPPFRAVADAGQLMDATIIPAAEIYWGSVATIITKEGIEEIFPRTDEEWEAVWGAAMTIAESGNLLMMRAPANDPAAWTRYSSDLIDMGLEAARAAELKDPEAVLAAGERVYYVCTRCHEQFLVE
jgi:hypothetical protein